MAYRMIVPRRASEYELVVMQLICTPHASFLVRVFRYRIVVEHCKEDSKAGAAYLMSILIAEAL